MNNFWVAFCRHIEPHQTSCKKSSKYSSKQNTELNPTTSTCTYEDKGPIPSLMRPKPKGRKVESFVVALDDDKYDCSITGIAVDTHGKKLLADRNNKEVKLFSKELKSLCSISVPNEPWDIAMIGENEAAVTCGHLLVILQVSDKKIRIKSKNKMPFEMRGICQYQDQLIVTVQHSNPRCVRLLNQTGKTDWSVSSEKGNPLFVAPMYVSRFISGRSSVVVTDGQKNTVTLLNADSGEILANHKAFGGLLGVTTDTAGNIYVCNSKNHEISILSENLYREDVFLRREDGLSVHPHTIAFDYNAHQVIVAYAMWNIAFRGTIDVFQVT